MTGEMQQTNRFRRRQITALPTYGPALFLRRSCIYGMSNNISSPALYRSRSPPSTQTNRFEMHTKDQGGTRHSVWANSFSFIENIRDINFIAIYLYALLSRNRAPRHGMMSEHTAYRHWLGNRHFIRMSLFAFSIHISILTTRLTSVSHTNPHDAQLTELPTKFVARNKFKKMMNRCTDDDIFSRNIAVYHYFFQFHAILST